MKWRSPHQENIIAFALMMSIGFSGYTQQRFVHTVTSLSQNCNSVCSVLDIPELNNNPNAVILISQAMVNGANLDPHPIGAYYMYLNKWSVYNLDATTIPVGSQFNVEYYTNADSLRFVYVVPSRVHLSDPAYVDHASLNNNPGTQIRYTPHVSATIGNIWNKLDVKFQYDAAASKWVLSNVNNSPVNPDWAYNIVLSSGSTGTNPPGNTGGSCNCIIPTTLPPSGAAGGDLGGTFPYPSVQKLMGKPLSNTPPSPGQVLRWNGSVWEPNIAQFSVGGPGLTLYGTAVYANNTAALWNATQLVGRTISDAIPNTGSVLKFNGTAWAPGVDESAPLTATLQTFFKNTYEESPFLDNTSSFIFVNHKYTITVTKNSRLVISGNFGMQALPCISCTPSKLGLDLVVNNVVKATLVNQDIASNAFTTVSVGNYMFDVTPGTYTIAFKATHGWIDGNTAGRVGANFSSIMVLPQ